jgi:hypothetical protein
MKGSILFIGNSVKILVVRNDGSVAVVGCR